MYKKYSFLTLLTIGISAALLTACGSAATATPAAGSSRFAGGAGAGGTAPLPPATAYLVGTFKLEGTDNAIDAKTALALIPIYQTLKELSTNNSAAQEEIDAVAAQIKATMTPAQIQAITAMNLTQQDLFALLQQLGGTSNRGAARTPNAGGFNGGGGPPGGFGGNGGGTGGGATTNTNQSATIAAARTRQASAARFPNSTLLDAMIHLLQQRAGIATTPDLTATPSGADSTAVNTPEVTGTPAAPAS